MNNPGIQLLSSPQSSNSSLLSPFDNIPNLPQESCYGFVQPRVVCGEVIGSGYSSQRNSGSFMSSESLKRTYKVDEIPEYADLKLGYFNPSRLEKRELKAE